MLTHSHKRFWLYLGLALSALMLIPVQMAYATSVTFVNLTLDSTTETGSTGSNVLIGEIARLRMEVGLPEGSYGAFTVEAELPTGVQYHSTSTLYAFVTNGGLTSSNQVESGCTSTLSTVNPTCSFAGGTVTSTGGSGDDVVFNFAAVNNADGDGDSEYVIIEFNVLVLNNVANQSAVVLAHRGTANNGVTELAASTDLNLTVTEPIVTMTSFTIDSSTGDAGDLLLFTVQISNTGNAPAYNVQIAHPIPTDMTYLMMAGATGQSPDTSLASGGTLYLGYTSFAAGTTSTVQYRFFVSNTVEPGEVVANTSTVTYTSLPGTQGTGNVTPGASGAATGERNGNDGVGGALNNYADSESVNFTISEIGRSVQLEYPNTTPVAQYFGGAYSDSTSDSDTGINMHNTSRHDLTIGETMNYIVTVTYPEGTITDTYLFIWASPYNVSGGHQLRVIELVGAEVIHVGSNLSGGVPTVGQTLSPQDFNGDGDAERYEAGWGTEDVSNNPDNISNDNDRVIYRVYARLDDEDATGGPADDLAGISNNNAGFARVVMQLNWNNTGFIRFAQADIDIVEPTVTISNSASPTTVNAGSTSAFTLTVTNTGTAPAYDVDATFTLPFLGATNYMTYSSVNAAASTCDDIAGYSITPGTPVSVFGFDQLLTGQSCTLVINATLNSATTTTGTTYTSSAVVDDYQSRPGSPSDLRTYGASAAATSNVTRSIPTVTFSDVSVNESAGTGNLTVAFDVVSTNSVTINYTVSAGSPAATGGGVDYTLANGSVTLPANTLSNTIPFTINNDTIDEQDEIFVVTLSPSTVTIPDNAANVTIVDNDGTPVVSVANMNVAEGVGSSNLVVSLDVTSGLTVTVPYTVTAGVPAATGGGVDYTLANGTATITAGNLTTNIPFTVVNDALDEANEIFTVTLGAPTNATLGTATSGITITDDDTNGVTISETTVDVTEGSTTDTYTVVLNAQPTANVTVTVTGDADVSVSPAPLTFTTANWNVAQTVTVTAVNDLTVEGAQSTTITHGVSGANYGAVTAANVAVNVTDNDSATYQLTAGTNSVSEAVGTVDVTVSLTFNTDGTGVNALDTAITVPVSIIGGTATGSGTDYSVSGNSVVIATNGASQSITVTVVDDSVDESDETIQFMLGTETSGSVSQNMVVTAGSTTLQTLTITDNDAAAVTVTPSGGTTEVVEGGATDTYTVVLTSQPTADVTITVNGTVDVSVSPAALTFTTGNWNVAQTVTVSGENDRIVEGAHNDTITHSISGGGYGSVPVADVPVSLTDNDSATYQFTAAANSVSEAVGTVDVTVSLTFTTNGTGGESLEAAITVPVTVTGGSATGSGTDYSVSAGNVVIPTAGTSQTVTVTVVNDSIDESDETVEFSLGTETGGSASQNAVVTTGATTAHTLTITDNDTRSVTITPSGTTDVIEGGATDSYTVVLTSQPTADVTITVTGDVDASVSPTTLTFTTSNWNTAQTVTVTGVDDRNVEGAHASTIFHSISGGDYAGVSVGIVSVNVTDNDSATYQFTAATNAVGEAAGTVNVTVSTTFVTSGIGIDSFDDAISIPLTVTGITATGGGVDFGTASTNITIPTSGAAQNLTITVNNDALDELDETVEVTLGTDNSASPAQDVVVTLGSPSLHTLTITDDDTRGVTVAESAGTTNVAEGGATDTYTVVLTSQPTADVTITANNTTQAGVGVAVLTFTPANWNVAQTYTVTAVDDAFIEGAHTTTLTHSISGGDYGAVTVANVVVNITDNDTANVILSKTTAAVTESSTTDSYTVVLTASPSDTVTITVTGDADVSVSPTPLTFTASDWNVAQTVTVTAVNDRTVEGTHSGSITHTIDSNDLNFDVLSISNIAVAVTDNDSATYQFTTASNTISETGGTASATVSLTFSTDGIGSDALESAIDVPLTVNVGSTATQTIDYTVTALSVTIPADGTTQTVNLAALSDVIDEDNETVILDLGAETGGTAAQQAVVTSGAATYTLTITDDDTANVIISETALTLSEAGLTDTYTIVLTSQPTSNVDVISSTDAQAIANPTTVTFTTANWSTPQTVTVSAVDDALAEDTHTGNISFTVVTVDGKYAVLTPAGIVATITDNDILGISVTPTTLTVLEGTAGETYTFGLNTQPTADVFVAFTFDNTAISISPASLTFTPANWNTPQTVTVTAPDEGLVDAETTVISHTVTSTDPNYQGAASSNVTVNVLDNSTDLLSNGGFEIAGSNAKRALDWKLSKLTTDQASRICKNAQEGSCTMRFKLTTTPVGTNTANLNNTILSPTAVVGDTLTLNGWAKGNNLTNQARIVVRAFYSNGEKQSFNVDINSGTYAFTPITGSMTLTDTPTKIVVMIRPNRAVGTFFVDGLTLHRTLAPSDVRESQSLPETNGVLPLPLP